MPKRDEVLKARWTWINFLKNKKLRKETGMLDNGKGGRCCLGHGCVALKIEKHTYLVGIYYGASQEPAYAPEEMIKALGMWDEKGNTRGGDDTIKIRGRLYFNLVDANDDKDDDYTGNPNIRPWEIAAYLESVINGGKDTPFKPLSMFKK